MSSADIFKISQTEIDGVEIISPKIFADERGQFINIFNKYNKIDFLDGKNISQVNISYNKERGTIRGLHCQVHPEEEKKMIYCVKGKILDIVVDLRASSKSLLKWHAEELSADQSKIVIVPEKCAHGFQTLTDHCEVLYLHTGKYQRKYEFGVAYNDPQLSIKWPEIVRNISERDKSFKALPKHFLGIG